MEPTVSTGEIVSLANDAVYTEKAAIGDTELSCFHCPWCEDKGTFVIELEDCVKGGKHGKTPTLKRVDRWLYPGSALLVLRRMFPQSVKSEGDSKPNGPESE